MLLPTELTGAELVRANPSTAIANDLPVYTVNPDDFTGITNLRVVEVPHPDADAN